MLKPSRNFLLLALVSGQLSGAPLRIQQSLVVMYPVENWSLAGHLKAWNLLFDQPRRFPGASRVSRVPDS